ncbi:tRNA (adenosine(37)-N6)-threonylcarbamoyltransferase complex ATPase subunit type 1 TsaE [uncultured Murdochiella sp.]|uniref:tRNA (adenosine(37)-N6)-threonylcarbamoyltransferase complex ATPase subunit type 1 TsaE n=1 Tax=uncultured Murdochiella sp. TaxID=1586095 RepID=UPI002804D309|nr:tRNA (adenosine(37)-N6)-threonylcarbamoyltransferase complex ATPase subunit type 1 TsaE [uncultured Murdochiella sp.]
MQITSKQAMREWSERFAHTLSSGDVVSLEGTLGAGKTQVVQWIAQALDANRPASSPTFSLVNHYQTPNLDLYHLDLYRLEEPKELEDLDYETYFYPEGAITFLEWAEKADGYLPHGMVHVRITVNEGEAREVSVWRD